MELMHRISASHHREHSSPSYSVMSASDGHTRRALSSGSFRPLSITPAQLLAQLMRGVFNGRPSAVSRLVHCTVTFEQFGSHAVLCCATSILFSASSAGHFAEDQQPCCTKTRSI